MADKSMQSWQAKSDMRTLAEAEKIKRDKKRFAAAQKAAKAAISEMEQVFGEDDDSNKKGE